LPRIIIPLRPSLLIAYFTIIFDEQRFISIVILLFNRKNGHDARAGMHSRPMLAVASYAPAAAAECRATGPIIGLIYQRHDDLATLEIEPASPITQLSLEKFLRLKRYHDNTPLGI
jgi:hypothetical protein